MQENTSLLSRRAALRILTVGAAVIAFPALLGFAPSPSKRSGGGSVTAPAGTLIMVIRHGEKPASKTVAGIDLNGQPDVHSLTVRGWTRAAYLPDLFAPAEGAGESVLPAPNVIYASGLGAGDGEGTRPRQTVGPLAAALGIAIDTSFSRGQEAALVSQAASQQGPVLICWQHTEIPAIAAAFGSVSPTPPSVWPVDQFDMVWAFGSTGSGWQFAEVPEGLLPGDSGAGS